MSRRAVIIGMAGAVTATSTLPVLAQKMTQAAAKISTTARRALLKGVKSWGYQLRRIDFDRVSASAHDLVVIDYGLSKNQRFVRAFTQEEIARAKMKPDGTRRLVLAYLSIGEAERYRRYWQPDWELPGQAPSWLGAMNPQWVGNYPVRFWDRGWQRLIFGGPDSYLADIQSQGFDGIYLDRADVFQEWLRERPAAEADMVRFVGALADEARRVRPDFLVVMQNAEELVRQRGVLDAIDGIAKEDLYFGLDHSEAVNPVSDVAASLKNLRTVRHAGKAVFVVEYVSSLERIAVLEMRTTKEGFLPHVSDRTLWRLIEPPLKEFRPADVPPPPP